MLTYPPNYIRFLKTYLPTQSSDIICGRPLSTVEGKWRWTQIFFTRSSEAEYPCLNFKLKKNKFIWIVWYNLGSTVHWEKVFKTANCTVDRGSTFFFLARVVSNKCVRMFMAYQNLIIKKSNHVNYKDEFQIIFVWVCIYLSDLIRFSNKVFQKGKFLIINQMLEIKFNFSCFPKWSGSIEPLEPTLTESLLFE